MHDEILTETQHNQIPLLKKFSRSFGLVGGTAVALHIGHRRSIDFDLFSQEPFTTANITRAISDFSVIDKVLVKKSREYTLIVHGVKWTFFHFPHELPFVDRFRNVIKIPDLLTLAAMKAYALGERAKWKDYVDMYFIMKSFHSLQEIIDRTNELFGHVFNEKLLRSQLSYFDDINYAEGVEFLPGFEVNAKTIKEELVKFSLEP